MQGFTYGLIGLAALAAAGTAKAGEPVDTALVLAIDVSLSVDDGRYALQKEGIAAAFETRPVADAIVSGRNRAVEVTVVEFSDPDRQAVVIPWTRLSSAEDAKALAATLRGVTRTSHGLTDLAEALLTAKALLDAAPYPTDRRIVDLSSDGMSNIGTPMTQARDALTADGITVNGLPILTEEPWLATYYTDYVIGGPDAFVEIAEDLASFAEAMRRKLTRELMISAR